jgi:hypothetical protein
VLSSILQYDIHRGKRRRYRGRHALEPSKIGNRVQHR